MLLHQYYYLTLFTIITTALAENPFVTLPQGTLMGSVMKSAKGKVFQAFKCIPYAKPPIDNLRFQLPQPAEPWNGLLDATKDCAACPQTNVLIKNEYSGKEDCLILNVYTTQISTLNSTDQLPVMVLFHGGFFRAGSSQPTIYSTPKMLMDRHVILVTVNYRLGALGFLSTGDEVSPGNYGLYDQVEALKWVKKNIAYFGGDPQKVTALGESAGAASVSHLVVSPKAKDQFQAAIMQSGSSFNYWALTENPNLLAQRLAHTLGCAVSSSKIIIDCLKMKSAKEIVIAQNNLQITPNTIVFAPVVENTPEGFFPEHPFKLLSNQYNNNVSIICGVNQEDAGLFVAVMEEITDPYSPEFLETEFLELGLKSVKLGREAKKEVVDHYFQNIDHNNRSEVRKTLIKLFTDVSFKVGAERLTGMLSQNGSPTFTYILTHRGQFSYTRLLGKAGDYGVSRMDELQYLFASTLGNLEGDDKEVSEIFLDLWTNFARTRDPTPGNDLPFKWLQTQPSSPKYLNINPHPKIVNKKLTENVEFWDEILGKIISDPNI